jgi:hypothetical protein
VRVATKFTSINNLPSPFQKQKLEKKPVVRISHL